MYYQDGLETARTHNRLQTALCELSNIEFIQKGILSTAKLVMNLSSSHSTYTYQQEAYVDEPQSGRHKQANDSLIQTR